MPTLIRSCKYGHGILTESPGLWIFAGVERDKNVVQRISGMPPMASSFPNGKAYAVKLWTCPVCGYMECFDADAPEVV